MASANAYIKKIDWLTAAIALCEIADFGVYYSIRHGIHDNIPASHFLKIILQKFRRCGALCVDRRAARLRFF